jgi:uncharacterized membrane protein
MQWLKIKSRTVTLGFVGWLIATNLFAVCALTAGWWPIKVLLFISLSLLPGLVLLRSMRVSFRSLPICILYAVGLSTLVLILSGLFANTVLYAAGIARPLNVWGIYSVWNVATCGLIIASALINKSPLWLQKWRGIALTKAGWGLTVLSSLLPIGAVFGAWRLNNGNDGAVALLTLCLAAALIVYVCVFRRRLPDSVIVWFIFILGLSVLLMTSMRGWDIVGHDLEREFRVFTLTNQHERWDIALNRDPYNACLSITILPQMYSVMLGVSGLIVFKLVLQVAFAACVAVVYTLLRQYTPKLGAIAGSLFFICYPTFINDAAMLTRQGVAYLFFALAILVISNKVQRWRHKSLFLLCAAGAILSHYSTAYMFVSLFAIAVACKFIAKWWYKRKKRPDPAQHSLTVLSPLFAVSLFLMTFIWYAQITATSGGLMTTIQKSLANIPALFSDENKSSDVSSALFFAGGKTQADLYEAYLSGSLQADADAARQLQFLPSLTEDSMPVTWLGKTLQNWGIDLTLTTTLRQHFAKVLQLLAVAGVVYAAYRFIRHRPHAQGLDFTCLSVASILLLALMVILPVLSVNYGILRAFQQALIFLILPIVLLLMRVVQSAHKKTVHAFATTGLVLLFALFTGIVAQLLGGTSPTITMNNQGLYHGLYYASAADKTSFEWMRHTIPHTSDVRAANFNRALMNDPQYPFSRAGILPTQTSPHTHVYVDHAQVRAQRLYTYYESSPLIMTFPLDYFDLTKNRIYSTTTTGVYK